MPARPPLHPAGSLLPFAVAAVLLLAGIRRPPAPAPAAATPARGSNAGPDVQLLPLAGPIANASAEVSGLARHGNDVLLLPQYPFRMSGRPDYGLLFALSGERIEAVLAGQQDGPLRPRPITLVAPTLRERSPTYEGCEALAVRAYLVTEAVADADTGAMRGFLFEGRLRNDTLHVAGRRRAALPPQTALPNMAYEAVVAAPHRLLTLYEANGRNVNPHPHAPAFSPSLKRLQALAFPPLEYRLTDATAADEDGRFWVANYFFPGERDMLRPAPDPLAEDSSNASRGSRRTPIERLVEFRLAPRGLARTDARPVRLPAQAAEPRNWEGLTRFESASQGLGFLLATDQYPGTVLGFAAAAKHSTR